MTEQALEALVDELELKLGFAGAVAANMRCESARLRAERNAARKEAEQLRGALASRVVIEQAKGMLAVQRGVGVDEAFRRLRRFARDHNARIHDVAAQVVSRELTI